MRRDDFDEKDVTGPDERGSWAVACFPLVGEGSFSACLSNRFILVEVVGEAAAPSLFLRFAINADILENDSQEKKLEGRRGNGKSSSKPECVL